jgi:transposase
MNPIYDPNSYIGIDVCKATLDVAFGKDGEYWQTSNSPKGIQACITRFHQFPHVLIVVESTGGLEKALVKALQAEDLLVALVHPGRVRKYAEGIGQFAKSDRIDAKVLASFGASAQPHPKPKRSQACESLSELVRRRNQVIEMLTAERNRRSTCPDSLIDSLEDHILWLTDERDLLTNMITSSLSSNPEFADKNIVLQSTKGVGPILSATLLSELPELGLYSHKQIAALVGVAPYSKDSGSHKGKRRIKGGRSTVRNVLYLGTLSAIRYNPLIREHYQQLISRGKLPKVAIVACMRKMLVCLNAMMRDMQTWQQPVVELVP